MHVQAKIEQSCIYMQRTSAPGDTILILRASRGQEALYKNPSSLNSGSAPASAWDREPMCMVANGNQWVLFVCGDSLFHCYHSEENLQRQRSYIYNHHYNISPSHPAYKHII